MHNDFLGDRRKAVEEEYFAKLNRTPLVRLRAANEANAALSPASGSAANTRADSGSRKRRRTS